MAHSSDHRDSFKRRCKWVNGPLIEGAGPSGLAVGACLKELGVPFVILERSNSIASLWRNRTYDRLKLHLPKQFCQLPKLPFPVNFPENPTKDRFIVYLESYAARFELNPQFNETAQSAKFDDTCGMWRVRTAASSNAEVEYICRVRDPGDGRTEGVGGQVIHASDYRSGEAYRGKQVLVVGYGNSGMEACLDLCHHNSFPVMVVRDSVHVLPREICRKSTFELAVLLMKWLPVKLVDRILLALSWMILGNMEEYGLKRPSLGPLELKHKQGKTPVLDLGALGKIKSGEIKVVPGIKRLLHGGVELVDGRVIDDDSVVLATGYCSNVPSWLQASRTLTVTTELLHNLLSFRRLIEVECLRDTDCFDKDGFPKQPFPNGWKGKPGLYAVGFTKRGLAGASHDAVKVAEDIDRVWRKETKQAKHIIACHRRCISQI